MNTICPGIIRTSMCEQFVAMLSRKTGFPKPVIDEVLKEFERATPLQRLQAAADIGEAGVFLASSSARNITGQALNVDGGYLMS